MGLIRSLVVELPNQSWGLLKGGQGLCGCLAWEANGPHHIGHGHEQGLVVAAMVSISSGTISW